jgi:hypothetical protein
LAFAHFPRLSRAFGGGYLFIFAFSKTILKKFDAIASIDRYFFANQFNKK